MQKRVYGELLGLFGWLLSTFVAAGVGAVASLGASAFYTQLIRPVWAPPAVLFGPVWTVLYTMMGVSAWLIWGLHTQRTRTALNLFWAQLVVNALWSWLFFVWHLGAWAFVEMLILLALIVATTVAFWRFSRTAALLLMPYLAWVSFATALTWFVWQHNPALLG
ncbi:sensory protein [Acidihalobacter aeolianus]|uniref:Sensory protein n=1 Tax=Acidihalobacter aeolianus TaxID=2792603 RepID=A0A1D8K538_9GAMM|nr:TspO/MBR family protein [Acidihalobacter aeolianus]AOV16066.1 sensory protein [Acidihalobacter aeolianus]